MRRICFAVVAAIALGGVFGSAMAQEVAPGLQKEVDLGDGCKSQEGAEFKDGKWVLPGWYADLPRLPQRGRHLRRRLGDV